MAGGMHGRGGACMIGGCAWQGDVCGRGHAWQGACMVGVCVVGKTAIAVGGTHPTGMHTRLATLWDWHHLGKSWIRRWESLESVPA